jgi:hypothetical protein
MKSCIRWRCRANTHIPGAEYCYSFKIVCKKRHFGRLVLIENNIGRTVDAYLKTVGGGIACVRVGKL